MKYMQCQFIDKKDKTIIIANITKLIIQKTQVKVDYLNTDLTPSNDTFAIPRDVKNFVITLEEAFRR